jgi:phosphatidylserine/phosphatidylglycerophosphate/cardiolipin synthase-like enzyme
VRLSWLAEGAVELIVQPADGARPVLAAIAGAQKTLDLIIFRLDLKEIEKAAEAAVGRGVAVRALIAHTNSGGEKSLRQLELRMLEKGVMVSRSSDELVRYHAKMMIVDREALHVYGYNFTALDLKSRSFGIVTRDRKLVQEALRLFEADVLRQDFEPQLEEGFVVSPENAREQLATFIKRARRSRWRSTTRRSPIPR